MNPKYYAIGAVTVIVLLTVPFPIVAISVGSYLTYVAIRAAKKRFA